MKSIKNLLFAVVLTLIMATPGLAMDKENTLLMDLPTGRVIIEMYPKLAPKHVERIKELVRMKFYDGLVFHRVIEGFMAQGGDPTGTGMGGSGEKLPAEFSRVPFERGTAAMARANDPNSADSQFFICFTRVPSLDRKYTIWGKVVSGMEHVDKIKKGRGQNGMVKDPDAIVRMRIAADVY
ncbi:peptidylprolyl isomerase [Pseudodesulfovibrio sp. zrk46]|uniref:peptidylprolyl isomerase n=1 Tax=Pseudodesulfovibrio sp. zrk46 TaxID=2725288 RepID=UPI001448FFEC|nr:peptidylprolyl isomerase [Pseudodesulfovibrio sp. zrk46]QJB54993.1 peptidylprolyl isomerase [Pseudodesulfovibrio sp. zrk46]